MEDDEFEWDDAKAARNWRDHAVTFEMARRAFDDSFSVEWPDDSQDAAEPRFSMVGIVQERLLFVAFTIRGDRIRIISARKVDPHERRRYHDENREA